MKLEILTNDKFTIVNNFKKLSVSNKTLWLLYKKGV